MSTTDGGPAFPCDPACVNEFEGREGMTLRDYFAAKAIHGFLSNPINNNCSHDDFARASYSLADAMLKARGESKESGDEG